MFSQSAAAKGLQLNSSCQKNVQDNWLGDPIRVRQTLINLLSNALKFPEYGSVSVELQYQQSQNDDLLSFTVKDTGIGMDQQTMSTLYDRFVQADLSTTKKYQGTGLGMAITKSLVDLMNGTIKVTSRLGEGSCFSVVLPLKKALVDIKKNTRNCAEIPNLKGTDILVAEDNAANVRLIKKLLSRTGASVHIAQNGKEAIELYESMQPCIILMDIQMPEMDGTAAREIIRQADSRIPIIALTADVMFSSVKEYARADFNGYIEKPIMTDKLYSMPIISRLRNYRHRWLNIGIRLLGTRTIAMYFPLLKLFMMISKCFRH